ncbi:iron-containing alcohol dehydrogenase [Rubinisphaera italica]|uniref:Alcohol dehydrogenase 2 n=1 Tax=Rubinisphaera italica TaxID=2527969 RepID=A0A5C5XIU9_9PLAN|nr:iron-containing alcohol dehydrogenase [Rubinisphaera italica]TWT62243.1 Alcohol dehydrogenase 2 [Rubinisphaera italica]
MAFDFSFPTRVVFGSGSLNQLGGLVRDYQGSHVFLITDQGLAAAGHEQRALESLKEAGISWTLFDGVTPNPTTEDVQRAIESINGQTIDFIVGLGGGSSMDCAKGVNFLLTNGGRMEDYWGVGKATRPMLPFIAIPTTAGTGSEAQSFALIANPETHMKMACGDKKAAARVAILDPDLTLTMPKKVAAVTAVDALSHAVETYVTKKRTFVSRMFSLEGWKLLTQAFPVMFKNSADLQAREQMLLGAHWAGAAIEQSMLGAAHALANPLTAHFNTIHGIAVGVMLPHVIRFNAEVVPQLYGELAEAIGLCAEDDPEAGERVAEYVRHLVELTGLPVTLKDAGVERSKIAVMAPEAAKQWTGTFNPRPVDAENLQELYECAWN